MDEKQEKFVKNFSDLRNPKKQSICYLCNKPTVGTMVVVSEKGVAHFGCATVHGEL